MGIITLIYNLEHVLRLVKVAVTFTQEVEGLGWEPVAWIPRPGSSPAAPLSALGPSSGLLLRLRVPPLDALRGAGSEPLWLLGWGVWSRRCKAQGRGLEAGSGCSGGWVAFQTSPPPPSSAGAMSEREERRFVEIPRESVRLMAESTGLELSDEVAALLAEDVCYRLREATQVRTPRPTQLSLATPSPPQGFIHQTYGAPALCFEGVLPFPGSPF